MKNKRDMCTKKTADSLGVYVHIPFCVQKCKYCDFTSYANKSDDVKSQYIKALMFDISSSSSNFKNSVVNSIFLGGGTPTCIHADKLCGIIETLYDQYAVSDDVEITLECNPATVSKNDLILLKNAGVNRLSIGLQSVHDQELKALGRIHTYNDFQLTYDNAVSTGFNNISFDLMYGIPFQTIDSFQKTLETVVSLSPQHISAYGLIIEPGTEFFNNRSSLVLPDEETEYEMYIMADSLLNRHGFEHYEISNYALNGMRSRHNMKYWTLMDYAGFGISAHSLINGKRYYVTNNISDYLKHFLCDKNIKYHQIEELPDEKALCEEYIMMQLRLSDGFCENEIRWRFPNINIDKYFNRMSRFIDSGHINRYDGRYHLSVDGMYVSNYILSDILDLEA